LNKNKKDIAVIGSGFAGLSAAALLAQMGYEVTLYEKNSTIGGRARVFEAEGFVFDMGPSWYWMPEVFEEYFARFGKSHKDFYDLIRLDPSYRVFWKDNTHWDIPATKKELIDLFEETEKGAGKKLEEFLKEASVKYEAGMKKFVWKPSLSILEFADMQLLRETLRLDLFKSVSAHIRKYFSHPKLIELLEFPVLFLGAKPSDTPALYTLMNFADMELGTWYPMNGMHEIIKAFEKIALDQGVKIETNATIEGVKLSGKIITHVSVNGSDIQADEVVCAADYHHFEQQILPKNYRQYTEKYWDKRVMAPSCLLFYLGIDKKLNNIQHHNLFFDRDFQQHAEEIYATHVWPEDPLFYVCCPSKTDPSVAPKGKENIFILIPVSTYIEDEESLREKYLFKVLTRMESITGQSIREHIIYKKSYAHRDFREDYNAFRGNAYGLANTLKQTAFLKPRMKNPKIENLIYTGQLTVPGPGMPPSIISGQLAAGIIEQKKH
jgi:phytoene desaturase